MKVPVQKLDEAEVRRRFPISDRVPGWFFRVREQSACVWHVEGIDLWGRKVDDVGTDESQLLENCIAAAKKINQQVAAAGS